MYNQINKIKNYFVKKFISPSRIQVGTMDVCLNLLSLNCFFVVAKSGSLPIRKQFVICIGS